MSATSVFYKDFLDVRRAKIVWFVGLVFSLIVTLFFYQTHAFQENPETTDALFQLVFVGGIFVPAIALVAAYLAIAGERESGSIKVLLSTPISRRDLVVGKYLSRASVVTASVVVGFAVAAGLSQAWFGEVDAGALAAVGTVTALYALAYMGVAFAISAATASRSRAMGVALAFYFLTTLGVLFGNLSIQGLVEYVLNDLLELGVADDPIRTLAMLLSPTAAYLLATEFGMPDDLPNYPDDPAWYAGPEAALVLLCAWVVVPVAIGLWRFRRADLG